MCGRFSLTAEPGEVAEFFALLGVEDFPARYNIAPTQPILLVIAGDRPEPGSNMPDRRAMLARWGLVPAWAKNPADMPLNINARSETAAEKPSFRTAMRHRRVLVPASGFYEWQRDGAGKRAQPYWMRPKHGGIVAFGGLMETYAEPGGSEIDTAAILTTAASDDIAPIHDRMPVVIRPEDFEAWLDCRTREPRDVAHLMRAPEQGFFVPIPVSDKVNKVTNTGPDLQERVEAEILSASKEQASEKQKPGNAGQLSLF
ncbi:MAG: SOS response-associated peptidase [Rhizobiaceae bacterium]|nr:SOS response-associated peptidase [Rhizobiaceae bacterium]